MREQDCNNGKRLSIDSQTYIIECANYIGINDTSFIEDLIGFAIIWTTTSKLNGTNKFSTFSDGSFKFQTASGGSKLIIFSIISISSTPIAIGLPY